MKVFTNGFMVKKENGDWIEEIHTPYGVATKESSTDGSWSVFYGVKTGTMSNITPEVRRYSYWTEQEVINEGNKYGLSESWAKSVFAKSELD